MKTFVKDFAVTAGLLHANAGRNVALGETNLELRGDDRLRIQICPGADGQKNKAKRERDEKPSLHRLVFYNAAQTRRAFLSGRAENKIDLARWPFMPLWA